MSEVSLSDTSLAILALNQAKEALQIKRNDIYKQLAEYTELINALDEHIRILVEHNHNCTCWRIV